MRTMRTFLAVCCALALAQGCRSRERERRPPAPVVDRPAVLAVLAGEPPPGAAAPAAVPPPGHANVEYQFAERGGGVAWVERTADGMHRVWHGGVAGPAFEEIGNVAQSPDGRHVAYMGRNGTEWRLLVDGKPRETYVEPGTVTYSPDGNHLLFDAKYGEEWKLLVDAAPRRASRKGFTGKEFTADSSRVWFVEPVDDELSRLAVADLAFEHVTVLDEKVRSWTLSGDRTRVAAEVAVDGGVKVVTCDADRPDRVRRGKTYERVASVDFGEDGWPVAYYGLREGKTLFVVEEDEIPLAAGELVVGGAAPGTGRRGFGMLVRSGGKVRFRQHRVDGLEEPAYEDGFGVTYSADGKSHAYVAKKGGAWVAVVNGKEGPPYDAVVSPAFSPDGRRLVYRARKEGRRLVVVADLEGRTVRELPPYEQVADVHFTADGRSIAYGVKDGRELAWKVEPIP